jgi:hypothetical protein
VDDPWWVTAMRVLALVGLSWGAWDGFRRMRADKKKKQDAAAAPRSTEEKVD